MTQKTLLKLHLRHLWISAKERLLDLWNIALPIFLVSGLLVACFRFWFWLWGWL